MPKATGTINSRIISYLGYSPQSILFGPLQKASATTSTLLGLPGRHIRAWVDEMDDPIRHRLALDTCLKQVAETHDIVVQITKRQKEAMARRYDKGVKAKVHEIGSMVMLWQKNTGKLQARWRGPFKITGYGGSHGLSFKLAQLNNRRIRGTFHGDHLKAFTPRSGYLANLSDLPLLPQQNIRHGHQQARKRLWKAAARHN